jgi:NADH-quinone oxidoreductase subunit F
VTLFESDQEAGGMLLTGIPEYRLPHDLIRREIQALLDGRIELQLGTSLGEDLSVEDLRGQGYAATFLATGAHCTSSLSISGGHVLGVQSALGFLKVLNAGHRSEVHGRVGVIGGGNTAIDAARAALRLPTVDRVTLFYRRTQREMPADPAEVHAAAEEGIRIETLVSPTKAGSEGGRLCSVEFIRNTLGSPDASGRRRPVPEEGSEFAVPLDVLLVAIGDKPDAELLGAIGLETSRRGLPTHDSHTLQTAIPDVFAGGDVATGPNTVVDAIAAGKRAATMIDRFLTGEPLRQPVQPNLPQVLVPQCERGEAPVAEHRAVVAELDATERTASFAEVELGLTADEAVAEARRCLRCDLEFTTPADDESPEACAGEQG